MARPKSDIDERIVQAARASFLEDGVDGASLRKIAEAAGTSVGMIYYYFPTKDDLFLASIERPYAGLLEGLGAALDPALPIAARLARMFERFATMTDEEHTVLRLVIRELLVSSKRRRRVLARFAKGHIPLVLGTLREGVATDAIADEHPPAVLMLATIMLGLAPQVVRKLVGDRLSGDIALPSPEALAAGMSEVLLFGIAKRGEPTPKAPPVRLRAARSRPQKPAAKD